MQKRFNTSSNVEEERLHFGVHRQLVSENEVQKIHHTQVEIATANLWLRVKELLSSKRTDRDSRESDLKSLTSEAQSKIDLKVSDAQSNHLKFIRAADYLNKSLNDEISDIKIRLVISFFGSQTEFSLTKSYPSGRKQAETRVIFSKCGVGT